MEQSIGMLTAANATLQDISKASTALRTITARIRNSTAELEELGESTDGLATSTAKYRQQVLALSGVDIMIDDNTFKSTFDILDELAGKWENLSDINKSSLTTLLAGTRQQAVFASLMQNWDEARHAVELCNEAGGSLATAYTKYTETISAKVAKLKTQLSEFANSLQANGLIGGVIDAGTGLLKMLTSIGDMITKLGGLGPILVAIVGIAASSKIDKLLGKFTKFGTLLGGLTDIAVASGGGIRGLSNALKLLAAGMSTAQIATLALTAALAIGVAVYNKVKQAREEQRQSALDGAAEASATAASLQDQYNKYLELSEAVKTDASVKEELLGVQQELLKSFGYEGDSLDVLIKKYGSLSGAIAQALSDKKFELAAGVTQTGRDVATEYKSVVKSLAFTSRKTPTHDEEGAITALQNAGYNAAITYQGFRAGISLKGVFADLDPSNIDDMTTAYHRMANMLNVLNSEGYAASDTYLELFSAYETFGKAIDANVDASEAYNTVIAQQIVNQKRADAGAITTGEAYYQLRDGIIAAVQDSDDFIDGAGDIVTIVDTMLHSLPELAGFFESDVLSTGGVWFDVDQYIEKLNTLASTTDLITKAQEEMDESGSLSLSTLKSVMDTLNSQGADYLDYLYEENGQIKLNTDAFREMQRAASEEGVATAEAALQQAQNALSEYRANPIGTTDAREYSELADNVKTCEKNLKLARNAANAFNKALDNVADGDFWDKASTPMSSIGTLSSAYGELESDGSISFSSLQKIREAFSDVDDIDRYINTLASAQGNTEETVEVLNQLATAALYTTFTTDELANANEDLVAAMLKEAGVANSVEVAHEAIAKAKEFSTIKSRLLAASEDSERAQILAEAQSAGILSASLAQLNYIKALFSNSSLSTSASVANLITLAKQADVTGTHLIALQKLQQELAQMEIMTATIGTTSKSNYTGGSMTGRYDAYEDTVLGQQQMKINQLEAYAKKSIDFNSILSEVQNMSFDFGDVGGGGGGDESTAAEKIKSAFDELNTVLEHYISLKEAEYNIADRNYDYDGMKTSLQAQVEYYKQIQENAHNAAEQIRAYYRSQGMTAEAIEQQSEIMALKDTWIAAADSINSALDRIANAIKEKLSQQIDDVQSAWQALSAAAEEYSNTGTISVDSLQAVIEAGIEYTSLLVDENGQLALNEEAVSAVLEAKTQQLAVETALGYIEEVRNALTQNNTTELARLLDVTTATTSSTWDLVYAQAALLNLNGDQYNQLISNINKFRSIATTTVQSVRKSISKTTEDSAGDYKSALDKILDLTMDLIKHEHEDMVDALNDQADAYQDIIDKKKELLEGTKDEQDYEREVAKRLQEVAKLQKQINLLSLDDSREAKAKKVSLEQELADLQYELNDYINDYTLAANQEALDKEAEQYAEYTNDKIKKIEDEVSSTAKLYELAIDRINNNWDSLYQDLMAWNYEYGSTISEDLSAAWDKASEAVQRYGSFAAASAAAAAGNTVGMSQDYSSDILSQQFSNAPQNSGAGSIASLGQQIQAALQSGGGNAVYTASNNRAQPGDLVITNGGIYRKTTGQSELLIPVSDYPSYVDSTGATVKYDADSLYKLLKQNGYIYHTGGIVGSSTMKQDEEMAILQNGELVATEKMQKQLFSMVDFVDNISRKLKALPYANGIGSLLSNNVVSGLQALKAPVAASTNNSMVFEPHIEVTIQHNGSISDDDLRGYGDRIAEVTLGKLSEAFQMRGVKSFAGSLLRG